MGKPTSHLIDPHNVRVGQEARYECPKDNCKNGYWHTWLVGCAAGSSFGNPRCYMHKSEDVLMVITAVRDAKQYPPPGPESTYALSGAQDEHTTAGPIDGN